MHDLINHPIHYNHDVVECIEVTQHMSYTLGNATKYLWRHGYKNNQRQDLEKALWYMRLALTLPVPAVNPKVSEPLKIYMRDTDNDLKFAVQALVMAEGYEAINLAIELTEEFLEELDNE